MLEYRPATLAAMLDISGVGQVKLDRYGVEFLAVINAPPGETLADDSGILAN
jgi:superfamily II DNA helicase RecQ